MVRAAILLLAASLLLSACGWRDSRLNPGNWFGGSQEVPVEAQGEVNPLIPQRSPLLSRGERPDLHEPIAQITELVIEPTMSGAIIRAEGIGRVQGAYSARLSPQNPGGEPVDGVLAFTFEVIYPENPRPVGPESARRVIVASSISEQSLDGVRTIRVTAAQNARESRRR